MKIFSRGLYLVFILVCIAPLTLLMVSCTPKKIATGPSPRETESKNLSATAQSYATKTHYDIADYYLSEIISILIKNGNWEDAVKGYIQRAENYSKEEKFEKARKNLDQAFQLISNHPVTKQLDLAEEYLTLGGKYLRKHEFDNAVEVFKKAATIQRNVLGKYSPRLGRTYNKLALCYSNKEDVVTQLKYQRKSVSIKMRLLQKIDFDLKNKFGMLEKGDISERLTNKYKDSHNENIEAARRYVERTMRAYKDDFDHLGIDPQLTADVQEDLAMVDAMQGNYSRAFKRFKRVLTIRMQKYSRQNPMLADTYKNMGICLLLSGDFTSARLYLNQALALKREIGEDNAPAGSDIHYQLGRVFISSNMPLKSLDSYQRALIALIPGFSPEDIYQNPVNIDIYYKEKLLKIMIAKAEALSVYYKEHTLELRDLRAAMETYITAVELLEMMRREYRSENYKVIFNRRYRDTYEKAVGTALRLYHITSDPQCKQTAFMLSEKSKAALLVDALTESRALEFADIPSSLIQKEKELKSEINRYSILLVQEQQADIETDIESLKEDAAEMNLGKIGPELEKRQKYRDNIYKSYIYFKKQHDELIDRLEKNYKRYYDLKYNSKPVTVSRLQRAMPPDAAIIEYFTCDKFLAIFVLTKENLEAVYLDKMDQPLLFMEVESYYEAIKMLDEDTFRALSRSLYNKLILPVERWLSSKERLVIIPSSHLYHVFFESLARNTQRPRSLTEIDYLINDFAFSYHYSARLWCRTMEALPIHNKKSFVGFAPNFERGAVWSPASATIDRSSYEPLPGAKKELQKIIHLFEEKYKTAIGYFQHNATEQQFKSEETKDFSIIHVATHSLEAPNGATGERLNPGQTGLIFDYLPGEDGVLHAQETYSLDLDAELIVLSSCGYGFGDKKKGEGAIALNRGFLYAGVRNTVFSLWRVDDKIAWPLMVEFYKNILKDEPYAVALKNAKCKMIKNPHYAYPKYWGAFILVGE